MRAGAPRAGAPLQVMPTMRHPDGPPLPLGQQLHRLAEHQVLRPVELVVVLRERLVVVDPEQAQRRRGGRVVRYREHRLGCIASERGVLLCRHHDHHWLYLRQLCGHGLPERDHGRDGVCWAKPLHDAVVARQPSADVWAALQPQASFAIAGCAAIVGQGFPLGRRARQRRADSRLRRLLMAPCSNCVGETSAGQHASPCLELASYFLREWCP
mmetsp:Transcript_9937/g.28249  ORF Transcript_9937/g.28249 Transcript_9937/m.28249 type:complete len:213 (-) Transcript_9937:41-679(-)